MIKYIIPIMLVTSSVEAKELPIIERHTPPMTVVQERILTKAITLAWSTETAAECSQVFGATMNVPEMKPSDYIVKFTSNSYWTEYRINLRGYDSKASCSGGKL